ncbi:MAG: HEPN domain-containing protein [Alphaproteobacteria bacterium]|nr:HEPN domain-containing protein [Alphaproteobacteria bacterium]
MTPAAWHKHMRKACRVLRSVQNRAASDEPETVISSCYYAMHHAACAVLLSKGQPLPKTHASLISRFGLTVRDLGPESREAGTLPDRAFHRRTKGDYDVDVAFTRNDVLAARDEAIKFVDHCRTLLPKQRRKKLLS